MKPSGHIAASVPLGLTLYLASGKLWPSLTGMAFSILIDVDHLPDYLLWRGKKAGAHDLFEKYFNHDTPYLMLFLHSWEWIPIAALLLWHFSGTDWAICLTLSWIYHLLWDQWINPVGLKFYFFFYRAAHGFLRKNLSPLPVSHPRG